MLDSPHEVSHLAAHNPVAGSRAEIVQNGQGSGLAADPQSVVGWLHPGASKANLPVALGHAGDRTAGGPGHACLGPGRVPSSPSRSASSGAVPVSAPTTDDRTFRCAGTPDR